MIARMRGISSSFTCCSAVERSTEPAGLVTKSAAPAARASKVTRAPSSVYELNMITCGGFACRCNSRRNTSPFTTGMSTSSAMRSGWYMARRCSAIAPFAAWATTSSVGSSASASAMTCRIAGESSTSITRVLDMPTPP